LEGTADFRLSGLPAVSGAAAIAVSTRTGAMRLRARPGSDLMKMALF
jgi:hypothetical protein